MNSVVYMAKTVLLLLLATCYSLVYSQGPERVIMLTDKDGLPQNKVKSILNDSHGYVWIGTQNGVAKYDGYTFKIYPELNGKEVSKLYITRNNELWLGTHSGLYLLDRISDKFKQVSLGDIRDITEAEESIFFITADHLYKIEEKQHITKFENDLTKNIRTIAFDNGTFYIGLGRNQGVLEARVVENQLLVQKQSLQGHVITSLKIIKNEVWAGTANGKIFSHKNDRYIDLQLNNPYSIKDIARRESTIWVGTDGNGVFVLNTQYEVVHHYYDTPNQKRVLGSNNIHTIMTMKNGDVWLGTYDAGICYLSSIQTQFKNLADLYQSPNVDLERTATGCFEDSAQNLWLGTQAGFIKTDKSSQEVHSIGFEKCQRLLSGSKILAIHESENEEMWIGTYDGGLGRFTREMHHRATYFPFTPGRKREQNINSILPFSKNKLLLNSMYRGMGILDVNSLELTKIPLVSTDTIFKYHTQAVRQFGDSIYAYLFGKDLCLLNKEDKVLTPIFHPPYNVNDFYKNEDGTFWLATRGAGLLLIKQDGTVLKQLDMSNGLHSNFLLRLEKDEFENLWVSSVSGLIKMDTANTITTFDHRHGLPSKEFTPFVSTVLKNKKLLFGTVQGFVTVDPTKQEQASSPPEVIISDITFQNTSIKNLNEEIPLEQSVESLETIELPFDRNSFTIHFFNDDFNLPKYNTYQYRMVGLEKEWINLDEYTHTTYTNLLPGTYEFQVNSTNKYNVNGDTPTTLSITILPPWYLTHWAFAIYIFLSVGTVYMIYRIILYRAHVKKELEFSEYKVEAIKDLNEKKLRFFTNITHDFKTPLTLISAPLEQLLGTKNISEESKDNLNLIKRNSDRLHHLIVDLLDFRKLSNAHELKLEISKTDINRFLQDLYEPFNSACHQQNITLSLTNDCHTPVYFDNEKVKRIMWNILSNSLKFTPKNGDISIACSTITDNSKLKIIVKDSGKGLTEEEIEHIFDRYYQGTGKGTGLGLTIVKGLAEAHRGTIEINSTLGAGSEFTVTIPYRKQDYKKEEIILKPRGNYNYIPADERPTLRPAKKSSTSKYNLPTVLVVEDNFELSAFLTSLFSAKFKVLCSHNGSDALAIAQKKGPDLIVSDVMMPVMNGYELCTKIKTDLSTSHIPVILLTANSTLDEQVKGMEHGADVYITKPFKTEFLLASVNSILENREKLRQKFQLLEHHTTDEESLPAQDQEFINKLKSYIDHNIDNPDLSIESLSEEMNCSKSSLIRKVKGLTGLTPIVFLRTYRLNAAYEHLSKDTFSVSEVSYKTGFADPNYFTTCFKKQFGKNPSQVKN